MKTTFLVACMVLVFEISATAATQPRPGLQGRGLPPAVVPEGVTAHRDLAYVENGHQRQKLDLYVPKEGSQPLPVILWIHGGGWQSGSKDQCLPLRQGYASRGYAIASIGYRLSDDAVFPAQIEDCKAAIRWLRAHAKQYHLDPNRFGVWGSSAGGHLVALVGTSGSVKTFDVGKHLDQSSRVQAVCDFYGPTDFVRFVTTPGYERHSQATAPEAKLLGGAVLENKEKASRANPITYVDHDTPPYLIIHGDQDPTVPINQSQALFEALKKAGTGVRFHTIHGAGHGGPGFSSPEIDEMVAAFFDRHLKAGSADHPKAEAITTESTAATTNSPSKQPASQTAERRGIPWTLIVRRDDTNWDGKISRDEFRGPPPLFDRLDRNHDGFITQEEHEAAF
jgi:acetyl esterase/lipase